MKLIKMPNDKDKGINSITQTTAVYLAPDVPLSWPLYISMYFQIYSWKRLDSHSPHQRTTKSHWHFFNQGPNSCFAKSLTADIHVAGDDSMKD